MSITRKFRSENERKNWENELNTWGKKRYETARRTSTSYNKTENYIAEKLISLLDEYSSLGSAQEKRLCRDLIDRALRRFHQYSIKERFGAFYFESPQPKTSNFEHIIPVADLVSLLLDTKIVVFEALYPPIANISDDNNKKLRVKGLVKKNEEIYYPFKRYLTAGIFTSSKIVDRLGNEIDPNSFNFDEHYIYIEKLLTSGIDKKE